LVVVELGSRFNGRKRWPLHVRRRRKKFMFAISSPDEFLLTKLQTKKLAPFYGRRCSNICYYSVGHKNNQGNSYYIAVLKI